MSSYLKKETAGNIVEIAVGVWKRTPPAKPSESEVGAIPEGINGCDSCASFPDPDDVKAGRAVVSVSSLGHNSCEGNDCINYDFPMGMQVRRQKGKIAT